MIIMIIFIINYYTWLVLMQLLQVATKFDMHMEAKINALRSIYKITIQIMVFFCFGLLVVFLATFWILINAVACVKTVFDFMLPEGRWCLGFYLNAVIFLDGEDSYAKKQLQGGKDAVKTKSPELSSQCFTPVKSIYIYYV